MTIKSRNRFNIIFSCIAIVVTVLQTGLFIYEIVTKSYFIPEVYIQNNSSHMIFKYNPIWVFSGLFFINLYVICCSILIHVNFEKTQSTQIVFFLLFLAACLFDSTRILLPLLNVAETYSRLLMDISYVPLFARILAPLSLIGITVLSDEEARKNINRNVVFIIITALFFAKLIPFNTAVILPNFCVSYGYTTAVRYSSFFICVAGISALLISNAKNKTPQRTTIGFALIAIGYSSIFYCYNIFHLVTGSIFITLGSYIYLKSLHKQYLWSDENYTENNERFN